MLHCEKRKGEGKIHVEVEFVEMETGNDYRDDTRGRVEETKRRDNVTGRETSCLSWR